MSTLEEHFAQLFAPTSISSTAEHRLTVEMYPSTVFTESGITQALNTLKNNKSLGNTWIMAEFLKVPKTGTIVKAILYLFNVIRTK